MANSRQERLILVVEGLKLRFPVAEIARKTGHVKSQVSYYLNGENKVEPSENFVKTFCQNFGADFDYIWKGKSKANSVRQADSDNQRPAENEVPAEIPPVEDMGLAQDGQEEEDLVLLRQLLKEMKEIRKELGVQKTSLENLWSGLRWVASHLDADREIQLHSLARLERKVLGSKGAENFLLEASNRKIADLARLSLLVDKLREERKNRIEK